jgi:hypothetical protein
MTYLLNSENRCDNNIISQLGKSTNFMIFNILLRILGANGSILISYVSTVFEFISSIT